MSVLAPTWALSALALDAQGDPHLPPGRHLRVQPAAALGLPLLPLRVHRVNLGNPATATVGSGATAMWRGDVRCTDRQGNELSLPFAMPADGVVDVWLPAGAVSPLVHVTPDVTQGFTGTAALITHGAGGDVVVTQRSTAPFTLGAARVTQLRLRGQGRVAAVRWVNAQAVAQRYGMGTPWRTWSLPLPQPQGFYTPTPDALTAAEARVGRGAPLRWPMQAAPQAAGPATAPPMAQPVKSEWLRLESVRKEVAGWLPRLTGLAGAPHAERLSPVAGNPAGTPDSLALSLPLVDSLWLSTLDPGLARWVGWADLDDGAELPSAPGDVVAYVVAGIWQASRTAWWKTDPFASLLAPAVLADQAAFEADKRLPLVSPPLAEAPYWSLMAVAAAAVGVPASRPTPPFVEALRHRAWLPAVPPQARRELVIELAGLATGPGLAIARQEGASWVGIHRPRANGQLLPMLPGPPAATPPSPAAPAGLRGRVLDRRAPPEGLSYRVAQCDVFGRWSDWGTGSCGPGKRPAPPVPQPTLHPIWPDEATWPAVGPLAPGLSIRVPVPLNESLAPGSLPLTALRLQRDNGPPVDTPLPAGPGGDTLVVTLAGPGLPPCGQAQVRLQAWWLAGPTTSAPSPKLERLLHDPRPPLPVSFDAVLAYGSRPDATGKSRIELRWTPPAGQALARVVYASETVLRARMRAAIDHPAQPDSPAQVAWRAALQPALAAIDAATTRPARAAALVACASHCPRDWFELLERDPRLQPAAESGRHVHEVSGQLQTLGLYRVVPVSASNVEGDFASAPMIAFAVPNALPPPQPLVTVRAEGPSARLTLTVPAAAEPAQRYRLRRTRGRPDTVAALPIVASGSLPAPPAPGQAQSLTVDDAGLVPWQRYSWLVEVQGADLPGTGVAGVPLMQGAWSRPSEPVSAQAVPPSPPAAVTQLALQANQTRLRFAYPASAADGGVSGRYRFVLLQRRGAEALREVATVFADGPVAQGGVDPQTGLAEIVLPLEEEAAAVVVYSVVVVDPLGRRSEGNPTVTAQVSP